jgi:diaminopimelate decarboxylase
VVDACIAELPLARSYSHRIFFRPAASSDCIFLKKGDTRILGRICMEDDVLSAGLDVPETVAIGDFIVFGDAGGYERSMSYVFGRG